MSDESESFLHRRLGQLLALAAENVEDGLDIHLSGREVAYLLARLAGQHDEVADGLRARLDPPKAPLEGLYDEAEGHVCAGQDADPSKHEFWYGSSSRNRAVHMLLNGLVRALLRRKRR